jgi:hypothetical protein
VIFPDGIAMKVAGSSHFVTAILILCAGAVAICAITGCGFSNNSAAEKNLVNSFLPVVTCSANPTSVVSGGSSKISATAVSPLGLPLSYSYDATGGSLTNQGNSATLDTQGASGNITVTCKAVDTKGNTGSFTTTVGVVPPVSGPPTIGCSANPAAVTLGGSATITAVANSPEGATLSYSWKASSGTILGNGNVATLNTTGAAAGKITVTCTVMDTQGLSASATTVVTVNATNSAPPTISCSANPTSVTLGDNAVITAIASSPEGRSLTYSWSASSGTITGSGATATLNTTGAVAGTITVTCGVTDSRGITASATTTVIVKSPLSPTVTCSAIPAILNQGGTAVITAVASSPQNLPLTYSYSTSAGAISGTGPIATLETNGASAGMVTVTCTVDQQGSGSASATANVLLQSITGEQALTAFQFTDSVGVNLHLAYGDTVYAAQFPEIMKSMIDLGVKHYRDGLNQYAPPFQYENAESLGKAGFKADWLMDFTNSAAIINSAYENAPDATAEFEGPNEDDANAGAGLSAFMQLLHDTVRGNPATAAMPIIAPSFTQPASFATQGNLASLINFGNTHDYFGNRNPETAPYGGPHYSCGDYGSMQFNICLSQMVGVNEPVVSTETGYQSGVGLSDAIIGRYELRVLFESLRLGINQTFLYELIDDPSGEYGLLTGSFSPRPAYLAIQNALSLLKDVGFAQPGKLNYTLSGQTQNVHHLLLQKSNGTFYLALWLGVQSADPDNPSTVYDVGAQDVTVTINSPIAASTTYVVGDDGNITPSTQAPINGSLTVSVTDRVTLVALTYGQSQ